MNTSTKSTVDIKHPNALKAFGRIKLLVGAYLVISVLTIGVVALLRNHHNEVNSTVWVRGVIVAATSILMFIFAGRAARGSRQGYLRVRIMSAIMVVAIIVIISLPGVIPMWMKLEQGFCALLLIGVVLLVNSKHMRSLFAGK